MSPGQALINVIPYYENAINMFKEFAGYQPTSYWQFLCTEDSIWRITRVLTTIGASGQPLSCSGTPEGIRRLCRCFSFLFSTFFFPLRFCLLFVFFLGLSCNEELQGSWTEAVVGHATLLCSVERLKQKYNVDINSRRDIKQCCTTTTTWSVTCGRNLVKAMLYLLVKQLGEGTKDWKEDGLNTWESWDSPEENKCWC